MLSRSAVFCYWIFPAGIPSGSNTNLNISFKHPCCFPKQSPSFSSSFTTDEQRNLQEISPVHYDSLRVLEWDKLIDSVASFATTSLGRQATKAQLWSINQSFEESLRLLQETNAAVEMHKHGACRLDFTGIDLLLVKSGLQQARRGLPIDPNEAIAVAAMLEYASVLQLNLKAATKEDADWYTRFLPLSEVIEELVINRSLIRMIQQVIDDDGSVKDSASPALRQARDRVRVLEIRLSQLLDSLIRKEGNETSFPEVSNIDGRWCITTKTEQPTSFRGLLLSSTSGSGKYVEPIAAVPLNDELQQARASVARAEADVLLTLTTKMQEDLIDIEHVLKSLIELDVVTARATYSLSFGGACPDIYKSVDRYESSASETQPEVMKSSEDSSSIKREWKLYMPKAYHPLLLQQYKQNLQKQRTYRKSAIANSARKETLPVPVDFIIDQKTRVLVITGPNTGGKTISLKTVGLAAMMAKTGLHVFSSESVQIPWFDSVFADIGDEQSLSQSLSTFSGHLKQISEILSQSTSQSLVLLDEVGAGTNPLEGAALGMSLLESFAESGALLTMATTHHGELKSLKYSNEAFENACMEFDEVNLKPTFKILWGVPGRSNAINISERLGLPSTVISNARQLYGSDSSEINEVILNMEKFKQEFQELLYEARHYQTLSRKLHERLLITKRNVMEHSIAQRYKKMREISEAAANARSILHKKVRQLRALVIQRYQVSKENKQPPRRRKVHSNTANIIRYQESSRSSASFDTKTESPSERKGIPEVGDVVQVSSLGRKATVLRVDQSKGELLVQAGNMKMKLKLTDIRP